MSDEYSENDLKAVLATVEVWSDAFSKSPEFARLNDSHQRKAGAITEFFARYTYEYLGLSPGEWDRGAVVECCTDILPRKVSAKSSFFEAVAPVLSAFFRFLAHQSLLPNGRVLAEAADKLADEIVAHAQDRSSWGPAKHFVMAAHEAGVDIQDQAALTAFMLEFNLRQAARSGAVGTRKPPFPFGRMPEPERREPKYQPPPSRYDPCPCGSGKKYKFCCEQNG